MSKKSRKNAMHTSQLCLLNLVKSYLIIISDPPKILLISLCNISNIAAMNQNINVEATELIDVMQREEKRVRGGSLISYSCGLSCLIYIQEFCEPK